MYIFIKTRCGYIQDFSSSEFRLKIWHLENDKVEETVEKYMERWNKNRKPNFKLEEIVLIDDPGIRFTRHRDRFEYANRIRKQLGCKINSKGEDYEY